MRPETLAKNYGCTVEQASFLTNISKLMLAQGGAYNTTPVGAYCRQRSNAVRRGVAFHLTLWDWWTIWQESGRWDERGRGMRYAMCRRGDSGPYAVGNVFIATNAFNTSTGPLKKSDLPMGVNRTPSGRFRAVKKHRHLGCFATPAEAHAAYLAAGA